MSRQRSVMQHQFSRVPEVKGPRSSFNRSHGYKTTFDAGKLIPFLCDEILPGDSVKVNPTLFARLMTPIVPVMDNMFLDTHFFFVPNRLIWENWQKFCGEKDDPDDETEYSVPRVATGSGFEELSLFDYLGIPTKTGSVSINALFPRAYVAIWNEWFRDQNLQDSYPLYKGDETQGRDDFELLPRNKGHDYFTSCLPWPQKGPGVELPLGEMAPVVGDGTALGLNYTSDGQQVLGGMFSADGPRVGLSTSFAGEDVGHLNNDPQDPHEINRAVGLSQNPAETGVYADISAATAITINSLRQAFQLQKYYERNARGGTRYIEIIRSHFNVISPDSRMQRPEYLGGGSNMINLQPVQQTSETTQNSPQGNLAAVGTCVNDNHGFSKSFTEHGILLGLCSVRMDLTYSQGLEKKFLRRSLTDYYWPTFAHLGEQVVQNRELYLQGGSSGTQSGDEDRDVFGYQERYAEYRYFPSRITGALRSNYGDGATTYPLHMWHLSEEFGSLPQLNEEFITINPEPVNRVIAVQNEPQFIMDAYINYIHERRMPVYSVPGLIDHF